MPEVIQVKPDECWRLDKDMYAYVQYEYVEEEAKG